MILISLMSLPSSTAKSLKSGRTSIDQTPSLPWQSINQILLAPLFALIAPSSKYGIPTNRLPKHETTTSINSGGTRFASRWAFTRKVKCLLAKPITAASAVSCGRKRKATAYDTSKYPVKRHNHDSSQGQTTNLCRLCRALPL